MTLRAQSFRVVLAIVLAGALHLGLLGTVSPSAAGAIGAWIDPGHGIGCGDVGASGFNGEAPPDERHLSLLISQRVSNLLGGLGYQAFLTRNSDHCVPLRDRRAMSNGEIANDLGEQEVGVVLVSVHLDGDPNPGKFGTFVIYPAPETPNRQNKRSYRVDSTLARFVDGPLQSNAAAAFLGCHDDLPPRQDVRALEMLKWSKVRSVMVECCFLSNQCQFNNIVQNGDQGLIANGIATGISNYLGQGIAIEQNRMREQPPLGAPYSIVAPPVLLAGNLSESFDGGSFPPAGWTLSSGGSSPPFTWHRQTDPLYVHAGVGAALVEGEYSSAINELLISPMFRVTGGDSTLRFRWLGNPTYAGNVLGSCEIRRKGESTWTTLWTLSQESPARAFQFTERTVGLSAWFSDSVQIGFRAAGTNGADFGIDEISTGLFPVTTSPTNDLCAFATPLPSGSFVVTGSTCYATNQRDPFNPPGGCVPENADGGDVFYSFTAQAGDTLIVGLPGSIAQSTHLYLIDSCDSLAFACLKGKDSSGGEVDSVLTYVFPSSGTYYLVVDAMQDGCSDFTLTGTLRGSVTAVDPREQGTALKLVAWPNPSRGVTVRFSGRFEPGSATRGTLRIVDATGRSFYVSEVQSSGDRFDVQWDGRGNSGRRVPPGRYIAKLDIGGRSASTPFVIAQ
jgi:N-acetylmuramoyl-L-alanine amidase